MDQNSNRENVDNVPFPTLKHLQILSQTRHLHRHRKMHKQLKYIIDAFKEHKANNFHLEVLPFFCQNIQLFQKVVHP